MDLERASQLFLGAALWLTLISIIWVRHRSVRPIAAVGMASALISIGITVVGIFSGS